MIATKTKKPEQLWSTNISIHSEVLLDVLIVQYVAVCGKQFGPQEGRYVKDIMFFRLKFNL
jgi:hypothetical protein